MPQTGWSDAVIAIAGIAFVFGLIMLVIWQLAATWRARILVAREEAYRKLAEQATEAQTKTAEAMEKAAAELTRIREATTEVQRLLREVD